MAGLHRTRDRVHGFTLLELSVVVLIITLLIGGLLIPLSTQVEQRNIADTQQRLAQIQDALTGFALANGRFPCPASSTSNGVESFAGGGNATNGNCSNFFNGFVPGVTLGLTNLDDLGYSLDAWGLQQNRIRYSITNATVNSVPNAFTATNGMRTATIQSLGNTGVSYLYVCASGTGITATNCGTAQALSNGDAVFVIYSLGKNAATSGGTSVDEQANLNGDPVFVSKTASSQTGSEFDDLLLWGSRYSVIGKLTAAGQLP